MASGSPKDALLPVFDRLKRLFTRPVGDAPCCEAHGGAARLSAADAKLCGSCAKEDECARCANGRERDERNGTQDIAEYVAGCRLMGTVTWFDNERNFGFVHCDAINSDVFIHGSVIRPPIGYSSRSCPSLNPGEFIEFNIISTSKGLAAREAVRKLPVDQTNHMQQLERSVEVVEPRYIAQNGQPSRIRVANYLHQPPPDFQTTPGPMANIAGNHGGVFPGPVDMSVDPRAMLYAPVLSPLQIQHNGGAHAGDLPPALAKLFCSRHTGTQTDETNIDARIRETALEAFTCKICLEVCRPPAMLCDHCGQIVGCHACVVAAPPRRQLGSAPHRMIDNRNRGRQQGNGGGVMDRCPLCRRAWIGRNRASVLMGVDELLQGLRELEEQRAA